MTYRYSVYTLDKRIVRGTIDAASERLAEDALYRAGYHRVLKLQETGRGLAPGRWLPNLHGVKRQEVIDFSRQLATLLQSGSPILTSLRLLEEQTPAATMKKVIAGLAGEIQEGSSFSQALSRYPRVFPETYRQVIRASELSGNFEVALRQVAEYLERDLATAKKVQRSLSYPSVVLLLAFGLVIMLSTVVLPSLTRLFTSMGGDLPLITRVVMGIGNFFIDYKFYLLGALAGAALLICGYIRLPAGRRMLDTLALRLPVIGGVNIQRSLYRFCRTAGMLLQAGLPMTQIVNTAAGTMGNGIIRQALRDVRERMVQGQGLSASMAKSPVFPPLLVEMLVVGENSGTLEETMKTMAAHYEQRVEQKVQSLINAIEPALIITVGLVVAVIAASMITPMYSILRTMQ